MTSILLTVLGASVAAFGLAVLSAVAGFGGGHQSLASPTPQELHPYLCSPDQLKTQTKINPLANPRIQA
jgi:hypothetical protein